MANDSELPKSFLCLVKQLHNANNLCGRLFDSMEALQYHLLTEHLQKPPLQCLSCHVGTSVPGAEIITTQRRFISFQEASLPINRCDHSMLAVNRWH